ncbi:glycoside hydrolase family 88 protein [Maribellus sp. YY47]|uniref:glycoside hydrolase family 88 protein n=1 Tax=Maribellus sp. YY47 TaxID=2929486 RepID=UPI00200193B4|nr:glycoside hydrolase family 88 protein [Maribellus sp. YY47]MCK3683918.1 glycoside hydrolase family 88 protein [Maribellus sp. YY47]
MKDYIDYFLHDDGTIDGHKTSDFNIDRVRQGNSMISLYEDYGDEKYKLGVETLVHQMEGQPRTNSGGFWHKKNVSLSNVARRTIYGSTVFSALRHGF